MAEKSRKVQKQVGQLAVEGRGDGGEAIPGSAQQRATPPQTPQTFRATPPSRTAPPQIQGAARCSRGAFPRFQRVFRPWGWRGGGSQWGKE